VEVVARVIGEEQRYSERDYPEGEYRARAPHYQPGDPPHLGDALTRIIAGSLYLRPPRRSADQGRLTNRLRSALIRCLSSKRDLVAHISDDVACNHEAGS
jgi:hypothetical protein